MICDRSRGIVGVKFLTPVWWVCPDEIESVGSGKVIRVAGVESLMDVKGEAGDAEFLANVTRTCRCRHKGQNRSRV